MAALSRCWLRGGIYFVTESLVWGGGRAFFDPRLPDTTPARAYLITAGQFAVAPPAASAALGGDVGAFACLAPPRYPTNKDSTVGSVVSGHVAPIRSGPYADCTPPLAEAGPGAELDYWCYITNNHGNTWTFVTATRVGISGWVYDDHLTGYGSSQRC